jgi:geranyl-CoA carboxylase alpha subunit
MVKAAAGGGGRGLRRVEGPEQLAAALRAARGEAERAFGSGELLLERALGGARHVEVQVFADAYGHVLHLGERDCSLQRRHQKLVEEAPSPAVSPALRERLGATAVTAAREIGYVGAGTVEFLLAPDGAFHFLEMNTRLQVEHPVTEAVTGLDLVAWQLRVAAGEPLPLTQDAVSRQGHAIEARLYGEDPYAGFLPQGGTVLHWEPPQGPGLRVEHGLAAGMRIGTDYDGLLAKVVAWGGNREEARLRLLAALERLRLLGVGTNAALLRQLLQHEVFVRGAATTQLVDDLLAAGTLARPEPPDAVWALAAVLLYLPADGGPHPGARWSLPGPPVPLRVTHAGTERPLRVAWQGQGRFALEGVEVPGEVALLARDGARVRFAWAGVERDGHAAWESGRVWIACEAFCGAFEERVDRAGVQAESANSRLTAPMNGRVLEVRARTGQAVRRGECLVTLEAMKLQHELGAPRDGTVRTVPIRPGQQVALRELLVELEPAQADDPPG